MKEIDRLKKNREERRAKQQEILEEKTAKQSVDPGNPNWEFLCMIRDYQEQLDFNPLNDRFVLHRFFQENFSSQFAFKKRFYWCIKVPNQSKNDFENWQFTTIKLLLRPKNHFYSGLKLEIVSDQTSSTWLLKKVLL